MKAKYIFIAIILSILIAALFLYLIIKTNKNAYLTENEINKIISNSDTSIVEFNIVDIKITSDLNSNVFNAWDSYSGRIGYITGTVVEMSKYNGIPVLYLDDSYKMIRYPYYNTIRLYVTLNSARSSIGLIKTQQVIQAKVKILTEKYQNNKDYINGILINTVHVPDLSEYNRVLYPFQRLRGSDIVK